LQKQTVFVSIKQYNFIVSQSCNISACYYRTTLSKDLPQCDSKTGGVSQNFAEKFSVQGLRRRLLLTAMGGNC